MTPSRAVSTSDAKFCSAKFKTSARRATCCCRVCCRGRWNSREGQTRLCTLNFKLECSYIVLTSAGAPLALHEPREIWQNDNGVLQYKVFADQERICGVQPFVFASTPIDTTHAQPREDRSDQSSSLMSAPSNTSDPIVEQTAINGAALETRGWISFKVPPTSESNLGEYLLSLAIQIGTPAATRFNGSLCDTLLPTEANEAKQRSLSKMHAVGEFPLHNDTAHWLTPCHYVMLACISPGSGARPTLLMDPRQLPLTEHQFSLLQSTPFRVTNGRNSFFSTILSKARRFVRFDPGCMKATTTDGAKTLAVLARQNWPDYIETVCWEEGKVVVIDNWRLLHGRAHAERPDPDRKLMRISIQ